MRLYVKVQEYSCAQRKEGSHIRALACSAAQDVDTDTHTNNLPLRGLARRKLGGTRISRWTNKFKILPLLSWFRYIYISYICIYPSSWYMLWKIMSSQCYMWPVPLCPSIIYTTYPYGLWGGWSQSKLTLDERRGAPWSDCQSITVLTYVDKQNVKKSPSSHLRSCNQRIKIFSPLCPRNNWNN